MADNSPSVVIIPQDDLRRLFNELDLWEAVKQGRLRGKVIYEGSPSRAARRREPKGTASQVVRYINPETGQQVAVVHQYRRPDGSIGGSGRPDPKKVVHDGKTYTCLDC